MKQRRDRCDLGLVCGTGAVEEDWYALEREWDEKENGERGKTYKASRSYPVQSVREFSVFNDSHLDFLFPSSDKY